MTAPQTEPVSPAFERAVDIAGRLLANIETVVHGKREEIRLVLAALACGGHVLFEDVPGTAKTVLARAIAGSIEGAVSSRIQCTPDLQPTDVTGLSVFNQQTREFEFRPGPIFANIVLVDEINRAMPKTQSALLEAMAERQVTVDGVTRPLPDPFLLIATENPIEHEGTFPLPEAQLDRFFLRRARVPGRGGGARIVREQRHGHPLDELQPVVSTEEVRELQRAVEDVYVDELLERWIVRLVRATRDARERRGRRVRPRQPRARAHRARVGAPARPRLRRPRRTSSGCSCRCSAIALMLHARRSSPRRARFGCDEALERSCATAASTLAPPPEPDWDGLLRPAPARVAPSDRRASASPSRSSRAGG